MQKGGFISSSTGLEGKRCLFYLFIWLLQHEVPLVRSVASQALVRGRFLFLCRERKVSSHPWPAVVDVGRAAGQVALRLSRAQGLQCRSSLAALYF